MQPERADHIRRAVTAIAAALTAQATADLSTDTPGLGLVGLLRPWLPRLRQMLLDRLSEADPERLEEVLSALAWTAEAILRDAPGEPLPPQRLDWEGDRLVLRPR
jgi:hypothetical protein